MATLRKRLMQAKTISLWGAQHPSSIRHLPRLMSTAGKSTLSERQPWLPFDVIALLAGRLDRSSRVFEYGGGGSTVWFADRVGSVVTVEHDAGWVDVLCKTVPGDRVTVIHREADDDYADYVDTIDEFPDASFDAIVVDGRQRIRCFEHAISKVKPGGLLLLDDVDRERYAEAFSMVDWPRNVYRGFAPCKDEIAHTAVFSKPKA